MNKKIYILVIGFILVSSILQAQQVIPISKSEVLSKVSENNIILKISEQEFNTARAEFRQSNAVFLPNISISHTGIITTNPLMAFGSKLNQEVLTQSDFNPVLLNDPSQTQNFATKFEIQQPIINVDGIYQRKAAKSKMNATALQSQRTSDFLSFEVNKAYMELQLAFKGVEVFEKVLKSADENKKLADNKFKQGFIHRADVLSVDVRLSEVKNQLQVAKSNLENASNYLSFLMNEDTFVIYKPSDLLTERTIKLRTDIEVSENRSDIKAMQMVSNSYEAINKADKIAFLPRINAFGSYELYDDAMFRGNANGYLIGAALSWDLFDGYKRFGKAQKSSAEFQKAKLEYEQYVSQSQLELNKAKRMFKNAENKLQLTSLALEQSEEALRIRTNRFKEGLEKISDLLLAETQYAQKQLDHYQTIYEYNYAQSYLQFLTIE